MRLDPYLQDVITRSGGWTEADGERLALRLAEAVPRSTLELEPGDEQWARILSGKELLAIVRLPEPIVIAHQSAPASLLSAVGPDVVLVVLTEGWDDSVLTADPEVVQRAFPEEHLWTTEAQSLSDPFSALDLWYVTL